MHVLVRQGRFVGKEIVKLVRFHCFFLFLFRFNDNDVSRILETLNVLLR